MTLWILYVLEPEYWQAVLVLDSASTCALLEYEFEQITNRLFVCIEERSS